MKRSPELGSQISDVRLRKSRILGVWEDAWGSLRALWESRNAKKNPRGPSWSEESLFYRWRNQVFTVDGQLISRPVVRIVWGDRREMSVWMWGWMTHEHRGAFLDPCKPTGG